MYPYKFKLYHYPAVRSARVKWLLHELVGDQFIVEVVELYDAEQYSQRYLELNPNHCVPTLEISTDDGGVIRMVESGAMIVFLADMFPTESLAPPPGILSRERADYLQMIHFCGASMDMMLWQIRIHEHVLPFHERDIRTAERYRKKFSNEVEPQLIDRLEKNEFLCGSSFSAADCMVGYAVMWGRAYGLCSHMVFEDYASRIAERSAFQSAFADAHKFVKEVPPESPILTMFTG
jgi:glutathione S-transferase